MTASTISACVICVLGVLWFVALVGVIVSSKRLVNHNRTMSAEIKKLIEEGDE